MPDIVGVRFKKAGKVYYFDPIGVEIKVNDYVVVQTARGMELGQVSIAPKQVLASEITAELKPIVRKAGEEDVKRAQDFSAKENAALGECAKMVAKLKLPMKLVSSEYNLDGSRLTFYFTAEERVDFRELVRELTAFFKTRIELRQIGPRDQAKLVGGLGRCGRALCCGSFLSEFNPVSIKMAKEQDLPLDPMKISGVCGRLQCCLAYESAQYREAKNLLPKKGQPVNTPAGVGIVIGGNPLKETVLVEMESQAEAEFSLSQITLIREPPRPLPTATKAVEAEGPDAEKSGTRSPDVNLAKPPAEQSKPVPETPVVPPAKTEEPQPVHTEVQVIPEFPVSQQVPAAVQPVPPAPGPSETLTAPSQNESAPVKSEPVPVKEEAAEKKTGPVDEAPSPETISPEKDTPAVGQS